MEMTESLECFARSLGGQTACGKESDNAVLLNKLRSLASFHTVPDGRTAPLEAGRDMLVFVANGNAKLVALTPGGREQVVAFHFSGDLVDVPLRLDHAYAIVAIGGCDLLAFPRQQLLSAVRDEPAMFEAVFSSVVEGLERCRENAVNLGRKSASERVASFLLTMARHARHGPDGSLVLDLPMSRRDLSDCLGLTIETISRQISEMRREGLIATPCRARVELLDSAELQARANHFASAA
jgi:CRP-like cAMP-binding protein